MLKTFHIVCLTLILNVDLISPNVDEEWKLFKENYHREYASEDEENRYFTAFKRNFQEIEDHNKLFIEGKKLYKKGITKFADLSAEEFTKKYGLPERPLVEYTDIMEVKKSNNTEFLDWREKGGVTKVKDQKTCGSCWIFSAIGMLESYYYRKTMKLVSFSEQHMVDCISNKTCNGGWTPFVFDYMKENGKLINKDKDYPYKGVSGKCRYDKSTSVFVDFERYEIVEESEEAIREALTQHGPLVVMLYASDHWKLYRGGVWYEPICSRRPNHALLLVGYGKENETDYWILKNSWGKDWGEKGYIKFIRNKHKNFCGLSDYAIYLI